MTKLTKLRCPECGTMISAADMALETQLAKCRACQGVFSFETQVTAASGGPEGRSNRGGRVSLPRAIKVCRDEDRLSIALRWHGGRPWVYYGGFGVMASIAALGLALGLQDGELTQATLCGIGLFASAALGALIPALNATMIEVDRKTISLRHWPIPLRPRKTLYRGTIEQVYVHATSQSSAMGHGGAAGVSSSTRYQVMALLTGQRQTTLLSGLRDPVYALLVQQELRQAPDLSDERVPGAYEAPPHLYRTGKTEQEVGGVSLPKSTSETALEGALSEEE